MIHHIIFITGTMTGFIAKSRLALGTGHNFIYRAKDENEEWTTACGDSCLFDVRNATVDAMFSTIA